MMASKCCYF